MSIFEKIPGVRKIIEQLQNENDLLKKKLQEKQEHINKTNAYWKQKFYEKKL
jgi:hypothetical protein